jgi:hypothetical protein
MSAAQATSLKEIQRRMAAAVMHPLTRSETMPRRRRDGASNHAEAEAIIRRNDRLTSFERLEIYNRQYWFRLYTSFEEDFPGLEAIVGRAKFDRLMREYLTECPSESFTLRNLGSRLEGWLTAHPEFVAPHTTLALDMVRLEWAHIEAFDAGELSRPEMTKLREANVDSVFRFQPWLRLVELRYAVDAILLAMTGNRSSEGRSSNAAATIPRRRAVRSACLLQAENIWLAVHRQENTVWYRRLGIEEFLLLRGLRYGQSLGDAIELAFSCCKLPENDRNALIEQVFAAWSTFGWIADIVHNTKARAGDLIDTPALW